MLDYAILIGISQRILRPFYQKMIFPTFEKLDP